jgi:phosphate transport system substrate-binding protein
MGQEQLSQHQSINDGSKIMLLRSGNRVNYQSVGSGSGVRQFIAGTVDFGATDEPIKASEVAKVKRGVVQIPMVGGTIADCL